MIKEQAQDCKKTGWPWEKRDWRLDAFILPTNRSLSKSHNQQFNSYISIWIDKNYSADTGEEGKNGKINFHPHIEPGPRDWESSTLSIRSLPRTKVYLHILSYVLPVVVDKSAKLTLAEPPNLVPLRVDWKTSPSGKEPVCGWQIRQQPLVVRRKEQGDKLLSLVMAWCLVYWTLSLWVQVWCPDESSSFHSFLLHLCQQSNS